MKTAEQLAKKIAADLFTAGDGTVAWRLALMRGATEYGGWSQRAVERRIADLLRSELAKDSSCQATPRPL